MRRTKHAEACGCGRCSRTIIPRPPMFFGVADVEFVTKGKCRRLALAVERGPDGELRPCHLEEGQTITLRSGTGKNDPKVIVTVTAIAREARPSSPFVSPDREGLRSSTGAWVAEFVLGGHAEFFDGHRERYLKRQGIGLTTNPSQAVKGEPAVTTAEQLAVARTAREKRDLEHRQGFARRARELEQIRRESDNQKEKQLLKRTIRNLEALARGIPPERAVQSACAVQQLDPAASTGRPHNAASSLSPEPRKAA